VPSTANVARIPLLSAVPRGALIASVAFTWPESKMFAEAACRHFFSIAEELCNSVMKCHGAKEELQDGAAGA